MIFYIKGQIVEVNDGSVILETNGIGYEIFCKDAHKFLSKQEKEEQFFVFEHIQENAHTLYGFSKKEDLEMLKILISVKGVGPKVGLRILNSADIGLLIRAIEGEDPKAFPPIKGVGDKAKKRLIMELKGKFPEHLLKIASSNEMVSGGDRMISEALEALMSLGLSQQEAVDAMDKIPKDMNDTSEVVKWALRNR